MNRVQKTHIGMINSFNVLLGHTTVEEIVSAGIGFFAHSPDTDGDLESIEFMMFYFKELEMYERCALLKDYTDRTFNEDGTFKESFCECENPEISKYVRKVKCCICNLRLKV